MVRAVNFHVAVGTGVADQPFRRIAWQSCWTLRIIWMPRCNVTLLTQERLANLEHGRIVGAVRVMAVGAIILYRPVLPEEGTPELGVAGVTGFIDRVFL